ncbi:hypothetical protein Manayef4_16655 [Frankia sp. CgMI4]|nr:hypothetical protein Manayef4_16655 [Frankia sp. CgIM4]
MAPDGDVPTLALLRPRRPWLRPRRQASRLRRRVPWLDPRTPVERAAVELLTQTQDGDVGLAQRSSR